MGCAFYGIHYCTSERDIVLPFLSVRPSVRPSIRPMPVLCLKECTHRHISDAPVGHHSSFLSPTAVTKFQWATRGGKNLRYFTEIAVCLENDIRCANGYCG